MAKVKDVLMWAKRRVAVSQLLLSGPAAWPTISSFSYSGSPRTSFYDTVTGHLLVPLNNVYIIRSTDGGVTWNEIPGSPSSMQEMSRVGSYLVGSIGQAGTAENAFWVSADNGNTWTKTTYPPQGLGGRLRFSSGGATTTLIYSTVSGEVSFLKVDPATSSYTAVGSAISAAASGSVLDSYAEWLPVQGYTLIGEDNGKYLISSDNTTFTEVTITSASVSGIMGGIIENRNGWCYITASGKIYRSRDVTNGASWSQVADFSGLEGGGWGNYDAIATSPNLDLTVIWNWSSIGSTGTVLVSSDNGATWTAEVGVATGTTDNLVSIGGNIMLSVSTNTVVRKGTYVPV